MAERSAGNLKITQQDTYGVGRSLYSKLIADKRDRALKDGNRLLGDGVIPIFSKLVKFTGGEQQQLKEALKLEIRRGDAGDGGNLSADLETRIADLLDGFGETRETMDRLTAAMEENGISVKAE